MQIYPSILESDEHELVNSLEKYFGNFEKIQIDIVDGVYRPNKTLQVNDVIKIFELHPEFFEFNIEFHLMVMDPEKYIKDILSSQKIKTMDILFPVTKVASIDANLLSKYREIKFGVVFEEDEKTKEYFEIASNFPYIQLMTVESGRQGNPFLPEILGKIEELRMLGYAGEIILDGGINEKTLEVVRAQKYLPDAVCPGSYLKGMDYSDLSKVSGR